MGKFLKKLLIKLKVFQVVDNRQRLKNGMKKLGEGYFEACRLNPYNPLSYIWLIIIIPLMIIMYGIIGTFEGIKENSNPFRWY